MERTKGSVPENAETGARDSAGLGDTTIVVGDRTTTSPTTATSSVDPNAIACEPLSATDLAEVKTFARKIRKGERPVVYVKPANGVQSLAVANPLANQRLHAYAKAGVDEVPIMAMRPEDAAAVAEGARRSGGEIVRYNTHDLEISEFLQRKQGDVTLSPAKAEIIMPTREQVAGIAAQAKQQLADAAVEIKQLHADVHDGLRQTLPKAMRIGELLAEAKPKIAHGHWLDWVKQRCGFNEVTAQRYMRLHNHRSEIEANTSTTMVLTIDAAIKAIAKPRDSFSTTSGKKPSKTPTTTKDAINSKPMIATSPDGKVITVVHPPKQSNEEDEPDPILNFVANELKHEIANPLFDGHGRRYSSERIAECIERGTDSLEIVIDTLRRLYADSNAPTIDPELLRRMQIAHARLNGLYLALLGREKRETDATTIEGDR
jgi:hypothetical protein